MPLPPSSLGVDWITTPQGLPTGFYRNGPDIGDNGSTSYVTNITTGLLASIPTGCKGLYACKWVNNNYKGPILKLRLSSDTSQTNLTDFYINKTGTSITTGSQGRGITLATWLGANTAYVHTWYDQSMGSNNAKQLVTTTNLVDFYSTSCSLNIANNPYGLLGKFSHTESVKIVDGTVRGWIFAFGTWATNNLLAFQFIGTDGTNQFINYDYANNPMYGVSISDPGNKTYTTTYNTTLNNGTKTIYVNGVSNATQINTAVNLTAGGYSIGYGPSYSFTGKIDHMWIFAKTLTNEEQTIIEGI